MGKTQNVKKRQNVWVKRRKKVNIVVGQKIHPKFSLRHVVSFEDNSLNFSVGSPQKINFYNFQK